MERVRREGHKPRSGGDGKNQSVLYSPLKQIPKPEIVSTSLTSTMQEETKQSRSPSKQTRSKRVALS